MTQSTGHGFFFIEREREERAGEGAIPDNALTWVPPLAGGGHAGVASTYASVHQHPSVNTAYNARSTQRGRNGMARALVDEYWPHAESKSLGVVDDRRKSLGDLNRRAHKSRNHGQSIPGHAGARDSLSPTTPGKVIIMSKQIGIRKSWGRQSVSLLFCSELIGNRITRDQGFGLQVSDKR